MAFYFERHVYQLMMINVGEDAAQKTVFARFEHSLRFE
jgi:hypothetical protein